MTEALRKDENEADFFMLNIRDSDVAGNLSAGSALLRERLQLARQVMLDPQSTSLWRKLLANCKRLCAHYPSQVERLFRRALSCIKQPLLDGIGRAEHIDIILDYAELLSPYPNRKRGMLRQSLVDGIPLHQTKFFEYYAKFEKAQNANDKAYDMLNLAVAKSLLSGADRDRIWKELMSGRESTRHNAFKEEPNDVQVDPLPFSTPRQNGVGLSTPMVNQVSHENRSRTSQKSTRVSFDHARLGRPLRVLQSESASHDSDKENEDPIKSEDEKFAIKKEIPEKSKISVDLSYIKHWSPSKTSRATNAFTSTKTTPTSTKMQFRPFEKNSSSSLFKSDLEIELARSDGLDNMNFASHASMKISPKSPKIERSDSTTQDRFGHDSKDSRIMSQAKPSLLYSPLRSPSDAKQFSSTKNGSGLTRQYTSPLKYRSAVAMDRTILPKVELKPLSPGGSDMELTLTRHSDPSASSKTTTTKRSWRSDENTPVSKRARQLSPEFTAKRSDRGSPRQIEVVERLIDSKNHFTVNGITFLSLKQIGSGGTSKVFRVLGPDMQTYALKKIKMKKMDEASVTSYHNEINLLKSLQGSPHIIKLVANEMDSKLKVLYVVMEIGEIDLMNKLKELKQNKIIIEENFLRIVWQQMLQAVNYIHNMRIIHGDLKPANFLFVNGALKLIDFGIAKAISNDTTNVVLEQVEGTANYMPPEVASSSLGNRGDPKKVGRAGDIWSLGCILYQIVYGDTPFGMVTHMIQKFIMIADPNHTINFPPLRNRHLADVIRSCLQWDPKLRPAIEGPGGLLEHPFLNPDGKIQDFRSEDDLCSALQKAAEYVQVHGYSRNIAKSVGALVSYVRFRKSTTVHQAKWHFDRKDHSAVPI
ncbi:hypothetical protein LEN26_002252 [Aphanomyces euteiches]|nr:hypothetical protein LEN26_002252 [Aphanomyces euteiches]